MSHAVACLVRSSKFEVQAALFSSLLVLVLQPIAAASHVKDGENGSGSEEYEIHGAHQFFSRLKADVSVGRRE
jgi:hypothetical protein